MRTTARRIGNSSTTWLGVPFDFGAAGVKDVVSNATLTLLSGNFSKLYTLSIALNGNQQNTKFTITYTDGTTSVVTQSISDWFTPQILTGETKAYRWPIGSIQTARSIIGRSTSTATRCRSTTRRR